MRTVGKYVFCDKQDKYVKFYDVIVASKKYPPIEVYDFDKRRYMATFLRKRMFIAKKRNGRCALFNKTNKSIARLLTEVMKEYYEPENLRQM